METKPRRTLEPAAVMGGRNRPRRRRWVATLCLVGFLLHPSISWSASVAARIESQSAASEYALKAAFIYNFLLFVAWPPAAFGAGDAPIVVGVVGRDPFEGELTRALSGKTIKGHPVVVRRPEWGADLRTCHVLFVAANEQKRARDLPDLLAGAPVLTIADDLGSSGHACVIRFVFEDDRVAFDVNIDLAAKAGLTISSKVLKLARNKRGGTAAAGGLP